MPEKEISLKANAGGNKKKATRNSLAIIYGNETKYVWYKYRQAVLLYRLFMISRCLQVLTYAKNLGALGEISNS